MLDYIVHGHSARNNRNSVFTSYDSDSEDYNTTAMTKVKNTGYYSDSTESLTSDNGPYMLESAAFRKADNAIKGKSHVHSVSSQTTVGFPLVCSIKNQHQSHTQITMETNNSKQKSYSHDTAMSNYFITS